MKAIKERSVLKRILRNLHLAAVGGACVLAGLTGAAYAGPEHDHGNESATAISGDGPKRLPDGSVFLPKPAQRQIVIAHRTMLRRAVVPHHKIAHLYMHHHKPKECQLLGLVALVGECCLLVSMVDLVQMLLIQELMRQK